MLAFPTALIEAAGIDGAGEWRIFLRIVLPSMKPALAATAIFLFMFQWNSFLWPLIALSTTDMYTFPVALSSLFGLPRNDYGQVMAGVSLATVPIILQGKILVIFFKCCKISTWTALLWRKNTPSTRFFSFTAIT
ncbi:ABC transporter permease subunit [Tepidibacillus marianensis]|uniref:carbohydrate ABC transporter permease n=1 Tax=Tepidibacillus marianensis TaxID=3131995 RepID=UPI0030D0BDD6